jgi:trimeric autotransporter adhesin
MTFVQRLLSTFVAVLLFGCFVSAQQPTSSSATTVPRLVNFSGKAVNAQGKIVSGAAGVTFAIYSEESGGSPLWLETQNIQADSRGNYTAQLGATKPDGLPQELFTSGEARWLGVRINGGEEQPRVLLMSVPYALKAADAQTLGGLPVSAFMLAGPASTAGISAAPAMSPTTFVTTAAVSGTGTTDFLPLWTNSAGALGNSILFQSGTGGTAKVGINTTVPAVSLDVNGSENIHGTLSLLASGAATATTGKNSQPQDFITSVFNSSTSTAVPQKFQWQAEPVSNNTASASGAMSLLYASGSAAPAETGLKISSKGVLTFASGQTFPGTGKGTVTNVGLSAPASDFTVSGTPVTTAGTLAVKWNTAPTSSDTPNAIVKRDGSGAFSAGAITATVSGIFGVSGTTDTSVGVGGTSSSGYGGQFTSVSNLGAYAQSISGPGFEADSSSSEGIIAFSGTTAAILGVAEGTQSTSSGFGPDGVVGQAEASVGTGVVAINTNSSGDALLAINQGSSSGPAALFIGSVDVAGNLSKSGGSFKIDHPLDPANKYLYHSFVESPDMMNIYNGDVTLDEKGEAAVQLPDWFESLNQDFRYQLTAVGAPGPNLYIAEKVHDNSFKIAGGQPGSEVSWQVTGIRHDAWANAHRIPVEIAKPAAERGSYIHPELFGAPASKSVAAVHHPMINHLSATKIAAAKRANQR